MLENSKITKHKFELMENNRYIQNLTLLKGNSTAEIFYHLIQLIQLLIDRVPSMIVTFLYFENNISMIRFLSMQPTQHVDKQLQHQMMQTKQNL